MSRFKFRLATLLRLRQMARDGRRAHLARAYEAEEILAEEKRRIEEELGDVRRACRTACSPGELDVDCLLETRRWELALRAQHEQTAAKQEAVEAEIERRRQALVETDRRVKVLENLRAKQHQRHHQQQAREEIKRLDEVAIQRTRKEARP